MAPLRHGDRRTASQSRVDARICRPDHELREGRGLRRTASALSQAEGRGFETRLALQVPETPSAVRAGGVFVSAGA